MIMDNKSISFHQNIKHNFSRIHRNPESKQKEHKKMQDKN